MSIEDPSADYPGPPAPGAPEFSPAAPGPTPPGSSAPGSPAATFPAPGSPAAPTGAPQFGVPAGPGQQPPATWQTTSPIQAPGMAYRPGAIPLRPLTLSDIYDGAFRIIRRNLGATVGAAVLVSAITGLVPMLVSIFVAATYGGLPSLQDAFSDPENAGEVTDRQLTGQLITVAGQVVGLLLQAVGLLAVTGMVIHVVFAATLGHTMTLGQAWRATAGRRWRLFAQAGILAQISLVAIGVPVAILAGLGYGISLTGSEAAVIIYAVFATLSGIALMVFVWIRLYLLAVPPLMLEEPRIFRAIGRGFQLTAGMFWRTFGIALLTFILTAIASNLLQMPFAIGALAFTFGVGGAAGGIGTAAITAISTVLTTALVAPFTAAVTCLQYLDLRIRKEALDVELIARSQADRAPHA